MKMTKATNKKQELIMEVVKRNLLNESTAKKLTEKELQTILDFNKQQVKVVYKNEVDEDLELKELMEKYEIPTFVSLAKVVNCKPQMLYSKKNKKTNDYYYGRIKQYLLEQYKINFNEETTIEKIVLKAREYLDAKESARNQNKRQDKIQKIVKYMEKIEKIKSTMSKEELELLKDIERIQEFLKMF